MTRDELLSIPPGRDGVIFFGRTGPEMPMHRHAELELSLVLSGEGLYLMRDRQHRLRPGTMLWLFPGQSHLLVDRTPDFTQWIVCFTPNLVERVSQSPILRQSDPEGWFCSQLGGAVWQRLTAVAEHLAHLTGEDDIYNSGLEYLLLSAWKAYQDAPQVVPDDPGNHRFHPVVFSALCRIRETVDRGGEESVTKLAEACGMSADHLSRLFLREVKLTIVEYRTRLRLRRFTQLLDIGRSIQEAAYGVGFGSYAQFHREFRRHMGVSPSAYRQLLAAGKRNPLDEILLGGKENHDDRKHGEH